MEQRAPPHPASAARSEMDVGCRSEIGAGAAHADNRLVEHDQMPPTSTTIITITSPKSGIPEMDRRLGDGVAPSIAVPPPPQHRAQRELSDGDGSALAPSLPSLPSLNTQRASPRTEQVETSAITKQPAASSPRATAITTDACTDASAAGGIVAAKAAPLMSRRKRGRPRKEELLARKQQLVTESSAPVLNDTHRRWRASISSIDIPRTVHIMYEYPETKNRHGISAISRPVERCISVEELESLSGKKQPETRVPAIKLSEPFPVSATVRVLRVSRRADDALSTATKTRISAQTATDKSLLENAIASEENIASDQVIELVSSKTATSGARQSKGL